MFTIKGTSDETSALCEETETVEIKGKKSPARAGLWRRPQAVNDRSSHQQ